MDKLTNKAYKDTNNVSRYTQFPYYYHTEDDKYVYGLTSQLENNIEYVLVEVRERDTLDSLALKYYGRPDYYWVIADFNRISDPFIKLYNKYKTIKIPPITQIYFK